MILRPLLIFLAAATGVAASSKARNPLTSLATVERPSIKTALNRITAISSFDLTFSLYDGSEHYRLSLEPSTNVIGTGATISVLGQDGSIQRTEPINRLHHKIYKGVARVENEDGDWNTVGWARINVLKDGVNPIFEGTFSVNHDNHHIQSRTSYLRTKDLYDPDVERDDEEFMVLWRDSDISPYKPGDHTELKRDSATVPSCSSDKLGFNQRSRSRFELTPMLKRDTSYVGEMSARSIFGKRQIDSQPGSGNTGGVNLASTIGQTAGCPSTRKVALVGVATDCNYTTQFGDDHAAVQANVVGLMNQASHVWETSFNISLGLQNLLVSNGTCPTTPAAATEWNQACGANNDIYQRLNSFSGWRGNQDDSNSHWTLLTACNYGGDVGLAWLGQACVKTAYYTNATGTPETVSGANVVALTGTEWEVIAHETGHTYGAVHDCIPETCSDGTFTAQQCCPLSGGVCDAGEKYIMNPYTIAGVNTFSQCTIGEICSGIGRNSVNTACLSDNSDVVTLSGSHCGNGIVEKGEQCDCGTAEECAGDPCCDPSTCKYTAGSVCDDANDVCCQSCQLASKNTVCRASNGVCDPAEYCTGNSSSCPADQTAPDGTACSLNNVTDAGDLACASGQCTSRNLQCQTVMGNYDNAGNTTYACDSSSCTLSCAAPAFGEGVCYGLNQNFLPGTPCEGNGRCSNSICEGATVSGQISSWVDSHKGLVIGVATGAGVLLLLILASCIYGCCRSRYRKVPKMSKFPPNYAWYNQGANGGSNSAFYGAPPHQGMQQVPPPPPPEYGYFSPDRPIINTNLAPPQNGNTGDRSPGGYSNPHSPSSFTALPADHAAQSQPGTWSPSPVSTPVEAASQSRPQMWGRQPSMRYA